MPKIEFEFDECEMSESPVDDDTLRLVQQFCGPKAKDKLLIHKGDDS